MRPWECYWRDILQRDNDNLQELNCKYFVSTIETKANR